MNDRDYFLAAVKAARAAAAAYTAANAARAAASAYAAVYSYADHADAVPRFTADEVAALVTYGRMTHPDGSHHVWVAGEHVGAYDGHDDADTAATEIRNAIRRTLNDRGDDR